MFVGVSKSIGGGVRIGAGTQIGGGRKKRGPTQRDLAKLERQDFLKEVSVSAFEARQIYLLSHGLDIEILGGYRKDAEYPGKDELEKQFTEINEIVQKANMSGTITANRKEKLVDLLFDFCKWCEANLGDSELPSLKEQRPRWNWLGWVSIFLIPITMFFSVFAYLIYLGVKRWRFDQHYKSLVASSVKIVS